jgi:hypothetical protein
MGVSIMFKLHHQSHGLPNVVSGSTRRRRWTGYTLIELLIVCAVLGISGALLIPHMGNRDAMMAQSAVRLIISDLCFAQSDALAHQQMRRVHFYEDGSGYSISRIEDGAALAIQFDPATADYVQDPLAAGGTLGEYIVNFNSDDRFRGVSITAVEIDGDDMSNGASLHFDELGGTVSAGGIPGTGGFIEVRTATDGYRITISPFTGKLTVDPIS